MAKARRSKETVVDEILLDAKADLLSRIALTVTTLSDDDCDEEIVKSSVCLFYRSGSYPKCGGCTQHAAIIESCKQNYIKGIRERPLEVYDPSFDSVEIRPKSVKVSKAIEIGLQCDACHMRDRCAYFKAQSSCSVDWETSPDNPKDGLKLLINLQYQRVQRATLIELNEGGVADMTLSGEIDRLSKMLKQLHDFDSQTFSMNISAKGNAGASNSGGGLLASIFGFGGKKEEPKALPVSEYTEMETIEIAEPIKIPADEKSDY